MQDSRKITLDSGTAAGRALLLCGLAGMLVGLITGATVGAFFFLIGAFYGAVWGMPIGFLTAVLGVSIGGRRGCKIAGTICGALGGAALIVLMSAQGRAITLTFIAESCLVELLAGLASGIGGYVAGSIADAQLNASPGSKGMFSRLAHILKASRIYEVPLLPRLGLAMLELTPLLALAGYLLR